jgi:hypothetical protein
VYADRRVRGIALSIVPRSIGTTQSKILDRQPLRTSLAITNNHASAIVYFRFGEGVDAVNGWPIRSYGSVTLKIPEDDPTKEVWAISDTATTPIVVYEGYGPVK